MVVLCDVILMSYYINFHLKIELARNFEAKSAKRGDQHANGESLGWQLCKHRSLHGLFVDCVISSCTDLSAFDCK